MTGKKMYRLAALFACLLLVSMVRPTSGVNAQTDLRKYHWVPANNPGFGDPGTMSVSSLEVFNEQLYAGTLSYQNGGSVWRYVDGKTWETVAPPGLISNQGINPAITDMIAFQNQLYAATTAWGAEENKADPQIWRYNGTDWAKVADHGGHGYTTFEVFNNELYVGVACTGTDNIGAKVLKTADGSAGSWTTAVSGGNGNSHAYAITNLHVFNGQLYAAVANDIDGVQVWRTPDGAAWETVVANGFGDKKNNDPGGFTVFGGYLYLGVRNEISGGKIYRTLDGVNWEPVTTDGFGDVTNIKVEGIAVLEDKLFAVTYNRENGLEIWNAADGVNWSPVQKGGFHTPWNTNSLWNNAMAVYNGTLFMGTSNYNFTNGGGEVWRYVLLPEEVYLPVVFR